MLESFKALKSGRLADVDKKKLYPLLRWCSGSTRDLPWCAIVNRYIWWVDSEIVLSLLSIGLQDRNPYQKYPKAKKRENDKIVDLKKSLVKRFYGWSEQEYSRNVDSLQFVDWTIVARALGCDKKQCKLLGVEIPKFVEKKEEKKKVKDLFDW
jgi:hypothetical protein